jgi:hypothetical protein
MKAPHPLLRDNLLRAPNPMRRRIMPLNSAMSFATSGKKTGRSGNRNINDISKESNRFHRNP